MTESYEYGLRMGANLVDDFPEKILLFVGPKVQARADSPEYLGHGATAWRVRRLDGREYYVPDRETALSDLQADYDQLILMGVIVMPEEVRPLGSCGNPEGFEWGEGES